jgi:hypothetical protein
MAMNRKDSVKVHVAAFGKHPGWDDHIEEIGLDSALLVNAKRVLYTECLGGNIDSGVWEKIDEDKRLPFKHVFYWKTNDGLLIGRMWASKDGKGRTKYPMVLCAHIEGVPAGWAIAQVLPRLAQVEEKCTQTNSAELVRLAIGEARRSLEDAGMALVSGPPPEETTEALVARLVNHPSNSGEGRVGLVRVLYEVQREMAEFRPSALGTRTRTRMGDPAAQHLRVPKTLEGPGEGARAWLAVLEQELAPAASVLVIEPEGQRFLDIIVGEPKAGQFRCVRSGEKALGLTSDVPYTMDDATRQEAEGKIESWGKGEAKASSGGGTGNGAKSGTGGHLKLVLAGAAILLLAIIIAVAMKNGAGSKEKVGDGGSQAPKPAPTDQTATNPPKTESTELPNPAPVATNGGKSAAPKPEATDPRTSWGFEQALERSRAKLAHLNDELKAEGATANTADAQKLDDLAQRAKIAAATPWKPSNVDSISHDVSTLDSQLAEVDKDLDQGLAGVASRVAASLQQRGASAPFQTEVMKRAWPGAVTSIDPKLGWAGAKAKADALQSAMQNAETSISTSPATEPPAGSMIDAGTLRAAVIAKRDEALQAAANGAAAGDSGRVEQAISQLKTWVGQANDVVGAAAQIESLMATGKEGDAAKIADLAGKAQASPAFREIGPAVLPVLKQADAMKALAGQSSPDALIEVIKGAALDPSRRAGEAVSAWSRLPQLGWPAKAEDLSQAGDLRGGTLANAVAQVSDAATKSRLQDQVASAAKAMWLGYVERAGTTEAALAAADGAKESFGITDADTEKLPAWARYNLMRRALGQAAAGDKNVRRTAIESFLHGVEALGAPVSSQPQVEALVAQLKPMLDKGADLDLSRIGPGASGWKAGAVSEDGSTVTYSWERGGTTHSAQFQRLGAADDTVTFMGTTEVPVGLFIDIVTAAGKWDDMKPLLATYSAGGYDSRSGPRVWEWSVKPGQVMSVAAPGPGDTSHGWLRTKSTMSGQEYYPAGLNVPPPSPQHPMQYVSPTAAVLAARLMGCRLPTSAEWKAALAAAGSGTPNLRDQTWRREYERAKELAASGPEYPAAGAFWPADAQKVQPMQDGTPAVDVDDSNLWFAPVGSGSPGFQNLIGNVAEFVWDDPASIETVEPTAVKVRAALGKGEKLHVIGGSALSPKEQAPTEPQAVNFAQAREGYSDVGFRLAFSAPKGASGGGSDRLAQALGASGYLTPAK